MIEILEKVAVPIAIGLISAFFAAKFAISKHRREKIWERRVDAYTDLIEALHNVKRVRESMYEAELGGREMSDEFQNELWDRSKAARREIERVADHARFLVTPGIGEALSEFEKNMRNALNQQDMWVEVLEAEYNAANSCLEKVKSIASKELKI